MRVVVVACTAALTACAMGRPDVAALFPRAQYAERQPLIVIPGLLGSGLVDAGADRRAWPPSLGMLIRGWRMRELVVPLPYEGGVDVAGLTPSGIVTSGPGRDYYASLLDTLADVGYECVPRHEVAPETNCVLFAWDWRLGFAPAVAAVGEVIDRMRSLREDPELRVDIVAHSAGALLARYYARFGSGSVPGQDAAEPTPEPHQAVRRAVLIGPPNHGAVVGVKGLMRGYRIGLFGVPPEVLATFETSYQLLPAPGREWLVDVHGRPVNRDIYDIDTWRELELSIFDQEVRERVASGFDSEQAARQHLRALEARFASGLASAERFHTALSADLPDRTATEYGVFGSDCRKTLRRAVLERVDGEAFVRLDPAEIGEPVPGVDYEALMLEPGDGRVTRSSLLAVRRPESEGAPVGGFAIRNNIVLVCARHSEMASNFEVRHNLLDFLLR